MSNTPIFAALTYIPARPEDYPDDVPHEGYLPPPYGATAFGTPTGAIERRMMLHAADMMSILRDALRLRCEVNPAHHSGLAWREVVERIDRLFATIGAEG